MKYLNAIRDKIPKIIRESGSDCVVKELSDEDFLVEMEKKLQEEFEEYIQSGTINELVDIIEVIYRIAELRGVGRDELEKIRENKVKKRGRFSNNLFLIETIEKKLDL